MIHRKIGEKMFEKEFQTVLNNQAVRDLHTRLSDKLIFPGHPNYHEARRIWNGFINCYLVVIIRCKDASDVTEAISFAQAQGWRSRYAAAAQFHWLQHC
jgi:hypothetical protein